MTGGTHILGNPHMAVCQNLVPLVNIKIAGKWMFIPLKMVLIGIDPFSYNYPCSHAFYQSLYRICFSGVPRPSQRLAWPRTSNMSEGVTREYQWSLEFWRKKQPINYLVFFSYNQWRLIYNSLISTSDWLKTNWRLLVDQVINLSTNWSKEV